MSKKVKAGLAAALIAALAAFSSALGFPIGSTILQPIADYVIGE